MAPEIPKTRRNIIANAVGQGWSGLLSILLIPVYISLIGVESYGLVGLFVTVQAALAVLDFGLAGTINRELARGSGGAITAAQMRNLVRTFEYLYWPIAALIAILSVALAPGLSERWLTPVQLSRADVAYALTLMGLVTAALFPSSLYGGGLTGLQKQGLLNVLIVVFSTLRSAGVIIPLVVIAPTIKVFLVWQLVMSVAQTAAFALALWRQMPRGERPAFARDELVRVWRFAGGVTGMAAASFVLMQFDRIVLASLLDLKSFGYYATAAALASVIPRVVAPVSNAVYPRYSQLVAANDDHGLRALYHTTNQFMAVQLAAIGAIGFYFSDTLLLLWTSSPEVSAAAGTVLSLLVLGNAFGGLSNLPYSLQLAHGYTRLSLSLSVIGLSAYVPALWFAANAGGPVAAAATWLFLNLSLLVAGVHFMHRRILVGEQSRWYWRDVVPVFAAAFAAGLMLKVVLPELPRGLPAVLNFALATASIALAALFAARDVRALVLAVVSRELDKLLTAARK